jgi:hypothetical protein
MIDHILPFFDIDHWRKMNEEEMSSYIRMASTVTSFATAILASSYLAYKNPGAWWLTTLSIGVIDLYTLPKLLRYGDSTVIQIALVANLAAMSSLLLGGIGVKSLSLSQSMVTSFRTYQFSTAFFHAFLVTSLLGYGIPLFRGALEKAYHLLHDPEMQERFEALREQFHHRPEVGLGFLQSDLCQNFILQLVLFKPSFLELCHMFHVHLPDYAWSIAAATSEKISLEQFNHILIDLENLAEGISNLGEDTSDEMQISYRLRLQLALKSLKSEDVLFAMTSLLLRGAKLIPNILSNEQFLQLLTEDNFDITNELIQKFLESIDNWKDLSDQYQDLNLKITQLEQEIQQQNLQQLSASEEDLQERYEELNQKFSELRAGSPSQPIGIEKVYFNKRMWQDFASLWDDETDLPFDLAQDLLNVLHDSKLLQEIESIYHSMMETGQGASRTLHDRLQYIKNKLTTLHGDAEEEEDVSAIIFLGTNKNGFIQRDYEDLQEWLNLDSPHDLEEAMAKIGLATEEDLYESDILSRQGQLSKTEIRTKLRHYIDQASKPNLADRIQSKEKIDQDSDSPLQQIIEKVTRFVFYAITSGLILAPLLIQPYVGATGFALGLCFFTLKRFGVPGTQDLADLGNEILDDMHLNGARRSLFNRHVFTLDRHRRELAQQFVNADLFGRIRMINWEIFVALFISHFDLRFRRPFIGSFFQGIACADEVVSLV